MTEYLYAYAIENPDGGIFIDTVASSIDNCKRSLEREYNLHWNELVEYKGASVVRIGIMILQKVEP